MFLVLFSSLKKTKRSKKMRKCARFEKVSLNQFMEDFCEVFNVTKEMAEEM